MLDTTRPFTFDRVVRGVLGIGAAAALIWLLGYLREALIPFAVALLMAYLLNPLVLLVQRKIKNRAAAVAVSLVGVSMAAVGLTALIMPLVLGELAQMGRLLSALVSNSELTARARAYLPADVWAAVQQYAAREEVQDLFKGDSIWKLADAVVRKLLPGVWGVISGAASLMLALTGLVVIGLYLVFLLIDFQVVRDHWQSMLPPSMRDPVVAFAVDFNNAMHRYFRAQALVAALTGALFAVGFGLIGLPLGVLFGIFVGLLNMVPYLQLVALIPAAVLALAQMLETGASLWSVLALTGGVFIAVQVVQDVVLVPRIMGKVTGLSPAMIMLSLSVWGKLLGILGLLVALPVTCLLLAYYRRFLTADAHRKTAETG